MADTDQVDAVEPELELGDTVYLAGGRLDKTQGILYGFTPDRFTIMPTGASDRVISVAILDGSPDPELGLEEVILLKKAAKPGFVHLLDLRAGQRIETFASGGVPSTGYTVKSVNEDLDSAIFADDAGEEEEIVFGFTGIPRELSFEVMRARDAAPPASAVAEEATTATTPLTVDDEDLADALPEDAEASASADAGTFALGEEIDLPADEEIKEISTANRIYPDIFQRSEMLSQLIRLLPEAQQRNPTKLQSIRRLVERFMYLRNQAVNYGAAGEPRGEKATSVDTLADLVGQQPSLARPVVNMKKVLYHSHKVDKTADPEDGGVEEDELVGVYLSDVIKTVDTLNKDYVEGGEGVALAGTPGVFYNHMETVRKINTAFRMTTGASTIVADREVFRLEPPGGEGVPALGSGLEGSFPPLPTTTIPYSLVRLLKERMGGGPKNPRQVEPAETPEVISTLLFPRSTARDLDSIRSGSLALDISRGMMHARLLSDWIHALGEVSDFPTADGLLLLGLNGIVGNVGVKEWLESQPLILNSVAEAHELLSAYGFSNVEWTVDQAAILQAKVDANLAGIRIFLARKREEAVGAIKEPISAGLLSEARSADLLARVESEPLLQKAVETLRRGLGSTAAAIDIVWFSALAVATPDLLLAVLGQQPIPLVRERLRLVLKQRSEASADGYKLRLKLASAGEPPIRNPCVHMAALEKIRQVREDSNRTKLLAKFLGDYRSRTEDNWVFCNVCDKHLLCGHELLQIQQVIRPKEREALYKEMILNFSAGTEGRSFVCRVCGQSLKEIEYDTGLEFDDEGRPMMGRSAMVDKDAIAEQEIEDLLSGPAKAEEEQVFPTEEAGRLYRVIKKIAGLLGIAPEAADYQRILEEVSAYTSTLLTRDAYAAETRGRRAVPDYDVYRSLRVVSAAAAAVLLDIQTRIPEYTIYFTSADCVGGFGGWPLVSTEAPLSGSGIVCISTVVAGINEDEEPWNLTTLQRQPNLLKRREALEKYVKGQVDMFLKSPVTGAALARKREWLEKLGAGPGGHAKDQLRATFRPVPYKISRVDAAAAPIVAAGASSRKAAEAWIREAHGLTSAVGGSIKGCCFKSLGSPAEAWKALPVLREEERVSTSHVRAVTTFEAGLAKPLDAKTDPTAYWRLFARLCWKGESKGRPHRLGLGLTCSECGLNFIENPSLTSAIEVVGAGEASKVATQLIQSMESQGVIISDDTFLDLLDAAHKIQKVAASTTPTEPRMEFLAGAGPLDGWPALLQDLQATLAELGPTVTTLQIATAADRFVQAIAEKETFVRGRIGEAAFLSLETLTRKTPRECGNALTTGFLVPFQRWLTGLDPASFKILDTYELSSETKADILVKGMGGHLKPLGETWDLRGLPRSKVEAFVAEVSGYCRSIFPSLRASLTPGGSIMVTYLLRAYVMGSVSRLLDPHVIPGGAVVAGAVEGEQGEGTGLRGLQRAFLACLSRYSTGSRIPSEDEIRLDLEKRAEAEKQKFIRRLDGMTREQRKVELMNKTLGIGEWAVGGTKAIRQYDEDRYEAERTERAQAGLTDYPEAAAATEMDSGYDVVQQDEDGY